VRDLLWSMMAARRLRIGVIKRIVFFVLLASAASHAHAYLSTHFKDGGYEISEDDGSYYSNRPINDTCWETKEREAGQSQIKSTLRCKKDNQWVITDQDGKIRVEPADDSEWEKWLDGLRSK